MGMELPSELRGLFSVLTGSEWPTADEDRLWQLADVYAGTAQHMETELPQLVIRVKNKVRENFDAQAADFFDESVDQFTTGERDYIGAGATVARELSDYVSSAGTQVQYAKWMIIGQLIQLAAEIAWAIAMAPATFGASLAKIPVFQAIARTVIGRVMFRLLSQLLQQMMISFFFAMTLDALIQRIQIDSGTRDEWDEKLTQDAANGAWIDGLLGTGAAFAGQGLSHQFNKLLGNTSGPSIAHQLNDRFPPPSGGPGREGPGSPGSGPGSPSDLPNRMGGVFGRNTDELLRNFGLDNRPGWARPVDGERFRTDMGKQFEDTLGPSMGRDQAREFGERYADTFARKWGDPGLSNALNDVIAKHGRGLDPSMRDFLGSGVPAGVRDGLADVGAHWKNFLAQLGGQSIANGVQGMLSEGFFNLWFSDEKTFSITWLSGVSGAVTGAVQHTLTAGGLEVINRLRNAGLPDGVPNLSTPPMGSDDTRTPDGGGASPDPGPGPATGGGDSRDGTAGPPPLPERVETEAGEGADRPSPVPAPPPPPPAPPAAPPAPPPVQTEGGSSDSSAAPPPNASGSGGPADQSGGSGHGRSGDDTAADDTSGQNTGQGTGPAPGNPDAADSTADAEEDTNTPPQPGTPGPDSPTGDTAVPPANASDDSASADRGDNTETATPTPQQQTGPQNQTGDGDTAAEAPGPQDAEAPPRPGDPSDAPDEAASAPDSVRTESGGTDTAPPATGPEQGGDAAPPRPEQGADQDQDAPPAVPPAAETDVRPTDGNGTPNAPTPDPAEGSAPPPAPDRSAQPDPSTGAPPDGPERAPSGQGEDSAATAPPASAEDGGAQRPNGSDGDRSAPGPGTPGAVTGTPAPDPQSDQTGGPGPREEPGPAGAPPAPAQGAPPPLPVAAAAPLPPGGQDVGGAPRPAAAPPAAGDRPGTPPPRRDPDEAAPVAPDLRPSTDWEGARGSAAVSHVGTSRNGSGIDTDTVEVLSDSTADRLTTMVGQHAFDVRRIPLPDPDPDGPSHVTELTVRMHFTTGPGVHPDTAAAAQQQLSDRIDQVLNQRYRLPGSGDQLHLRVEPAGPEDDPHSTVTWVTDNPGLPGRSDADNWRVADGADAWVHETLHRIGLRDEYAELPAGDGRRHPPIFRQRPDQSGVHEAGGYMDTFPGPGGPTPKVLNSYLDRIEAQVDGASHYDAPVRLADLPPSVHRYLAAGLDPGGTHTTADTINLFGAAYDSRVRGRDGALVRADLPPRLRGPFDRAAAAWNTDGRFDWAVQTARHFGAEGPMSQRPAPPAPAAVVPTQGGATRFDLPTRLGDLPASVHRDIAAGLDPNGTRSTADTIDLLGAAYDSRVRGRSDDLVLAELPPRLHGQYESTVRAWDADGRFDWAVETARYRGHQDTPAEQSAPPAPPPPVRTHGESHPPPAPPKLFASLFGTASSSDSTATGHELADLDGATQRETGQETEQQDPPEVTPPGRDPERRIGPDNQHDTPAVRDEDTLDLLDALRTTGGDRQSGGYTGTHRGQGHVSEIAARLRTRFAHEGIQVDARLLHRAVREAVNHADANRGRPRMPVQIPVTAEGPGGTQHGRASITAGDWTWRATTDAANPATKGEDTAETRNRVVGAGAQQSRKQVNPAFPVSVIGSIAEKTSLISARLKTPFTVRQRGMEYQTTAERRHKSKVAVDGDNPTRYTSGTTTHARVDFDPVRPAGPDGPPGADGAPAARPARATPPPMDFTDDWTGVTEVVLPGHVRPGGATTAPDSTATGTAPERTPAPQQFRTDGNPPDHTGGPGRPVRAPRFSQTLAVPADALPDGFPTDGQYLREKLPELDRGDVLRVPYTGSDGQPHLLQLSGGPVAYERIGPELTDSSFSGTGKSVANASSSAVRTDKQEVRASGGVLAGLTDGPAVVRIGPEAGVGAKASQKHSRATEHGSERTRTTDAKGDSALYRTQRTYQLTTTEPQAGEGAAAPRVASGSLDFTTIDQVLTRDALDLAGQAPPLPGGAPAQPTTSGLGADRVHHFGDAAPVRAEWNGGDLRDARGESPLDAAARRAHEVVHRAYPDLVLPPGDGPVPSRGFWKKIWIGQDLRSQNTLTLYEQIGGAIGGPDGLLAPGTDIRLRTGGLRNALLPAPGLRKKILGTVLHIAPVRDDQRDGADFVTVRLAASLQEARYEGSRTDGSLTTGLTGTVSQGAGMDRMTGAGVEGSFAAQVRIGSTPSGLPRGMVEFGGGSSYDYEKTTPASGTSKAGVDAAAAAKGTLDSWSYALDLSITLGSDPAEHAITPQGPDTGDGADRRPRVVVEGPRTTSVPGEVAPAGSQSERIDRAQQAFTADQQARERTDAAAAAADRARHELDTDTVLAAHLDTRTEAATTASERAQDLAERAAEQRATAERAAAGAQTAETAAQTDRDAADTARARAADSAHTAAQQRRDAIEALHAYTDALNDQIGRPSADRAPLPPARTPWTDPDGAGPQRPDDAFTRAQADRDALDQPYRDAEQEAAEAENAARDARSGAEPAQTAPGSAPQRPSPAGADTADQTSRAHTGDADRARTTAQESQRTAAEHRATADEAAAAAARAAEQAGEAQRAATAAEAERQQSHDASRRLDDRRTGLRQALDTERTARAHEAAAAAEARNQHFALERDGRLRAEPGPDGAPRRRPALDLEGRPSAPRNVDAPDLAAAVRDSVRNAPGAQEAARSGEAVTGHWDMLTSPTVLAANTADLHNGGLPLQSQYEGHLRSDITTDITAQRETMTTSAAVKDGGIDLTLKSEAGRGTGASSSHALDTKAGFKGEASLVPGADAYNRFRFTAGATPYASKKTRTTGDTQTSADEEKISFPGGTLDVTTSDTFRVDTRIKTRWNFGASVPISSRSQTSTGLPAPPPPNRTSHDSQHSAASSPTAPPPGRPGQGHGTVSTRHRILDLAQDGALPGTRGLDGALTRARATPPHTEPVPGRHSTGYAFTPIDTAAAADTIARQVRDQAGVDLTDQALHDIKTALSASDTRGANRRLQTGGLVVPVRVREGGPLGEQRFTSHGWIRLGLGRSGAPQFGPAESGFSTEWSGSRSDEHNASSAKQIKRGLTAAVEGGVNPVGPTGTNADGTASYPRNRYQSNTFNAGTGVEGATTSTDLASDTDTRTTSRTVTAPGAGADTRFTIDYTLTAGSSAGKVRTASGSVDAGPRREVFPTGSFRPGPVPAADGAPPAPARPRAGDRPVHTDPQRFTPPPPGEDAPAPRTYADHWRAGLARPQHTLPPVESVDHRPVAGAALRAQARAFGWDPEGTRGPIEHLRTQRPGTRADMLPAAVDEQVLRGVFGAASTDGGASLVGEDPQGPFAVPGLDTRMFTQVDYAGAEIIGAAGGSGLKTGTETQHLHRDEHATTHAGSTALTTDASLAGMKAVDTEPASGFNERQVMVGGGNSTAGAASTAAGGSKTAASTQRTDAAPPTAKSDGYLVRFPVDVLITAQDTRSSAPPAGETVQTTVDVWLGPESLTLLGTGITPEHRAAWDAAATAQTRAAETEAALDTAVFSELGLDAGADPAQPANRARDLLALDADRNPREWSPETAAAVGALRDYLGSTGPDHGWDRTTEQTDRSRTAADAALTQLDSTAGNPGGLDHGTVQGMQDLVRHRGGLEQALSDHRTALDTYFQNLDTAFSTPARPAPEPTNTPVRAAAPPPRPAPPAPPTETTLQAAFSAALNPAT